MYCSPTLKFSLIAIFSVLVSYCPYKGVDHILLIDENHITNSWGRFSTEDALKLLHMDVPLNRQIDRNRASLHVNRQFVHSNCLFIRNG
jgi:hypothetical protein